MKFGELESVQLIGKGGMSEVYEAVNPRLGSRHAVKVYTYQKEDAEVRARFEQEGRLLATLCHPRIVGVSDVGVLTGNHPYFVMDLVLNPDGKPQTLAMAAAEGVNEDQVARWYDDIREGLAAIHGKGIVHRDLKLENIMIGSDGHAVLTDFGIAHIGRAKDGRVMVADPVSTILAIRDGKKALMGSLGYMAPELEMGCAATPASDWYALGVIIYRLLTGTWCDARTNLGEALETFDPAWGKILPKLLHSNPAGRACPSFAEMAHQLHEDKVAADEMRYRKEKLRGHVARHVARWLAGCGFLLVTVILFEFFELRTARKQLNRPTFDELFSIPEEAKSDNSEEYENGTTTMPSREQFAASRVDALVLMHPTLAAFSKGDITYEKAIADFEEMADKLVENDAGNSPLDNLEFGQGEYKPVGDDAETLRFLLLRAVDKLRARSEME